MLAADAIKQRLVNLRRLGRNLKLYLCCKAVLRSEAAHNHREIARLNDVKVTLGTILVGDIFRVIQDVW